MSKPVFIFGFVLALGGGAFAACSFPDVEFAPEGSVVTEAGGAETSTGADGMTADGQALGDSGPPVNPDVDPEGGVQDATVVSDASQRVDAEAGCCDCDDDHVKATGTCSFPTGDCDDFNKFVFTGQGFVDSTNWESTHVPAYDWDCDNTVFKQYAHGLKPCASQLKALGCTQYQGGFTDDPACGAPGHYVISCTPDPALLGLNCIETTADARHQGCH